MTSQKFKQDLNDMAYTYFQTGFEKCQEQFEEAFILPADKENFPNLYMVIVFFPDEAAEGLEKETTKKAGPK